MRIRFFHKDTDAAGTEMGKFAVRFHRLVEFVECGTGTCLPASNSSCGPLGFDPTDCVTPSGITLLHGTEIPAINRHQHWNYDCSQSNTGGSSFAVTVNSVNLPAGTNNVFAVTFTATTTSVTDSANGVTTTPTNAKFDVVITPIWTVSNSKVALLAYIDHRPLSASAGTATVQASTDTSGNEKEFICAEPTCKTFFKFTQCWTTGTNGVADHSCAPAATGQCAATTPGCYQVIRSVLSTSTDPDDSSERDPDEWSDVVGFTFDQGTAAQPTQIVWDPTLAGPDGAASSAKLLAPVAVLVFSVLAAFA